MKLAFWRREPDTRPDPDTELRLAQSKVDRVKFLAAEHTRVTEEIEQRVTENHISAAIDAWFHAPPRHRTKMPPRRKSA